MPLSEIAVAYLWFVLVVTCALMLALTFADQKLRDNWRYLQRPRPKPEPPPAVDRDFARIETSIACLLQSGFRSAQVTVRHEDSKRQFEFKKYIRDVGDYGLELILPAYKWARNYLPKVQAYCEESGIPYRIRPKRSPRSREVLFVDCGRDLETARVLARKVWTEIFELPDNAFYRVDAYGISPHGELVDRPEQKPMAFAQWWHQTYRNSEDPFDRTPGGCVIRSLWVISFPIIFFGLLISVIGSHGEPADWFVGLAETTLSGSTAGLVFFSLYLANVALVLLYGTPARQTFRPELRVVARVWTWTVRITLPLAVILVWTGV